MILFGTTPSASHAAEGARAANSEKKICQVAIDPTFRRKIDIEFPNGKRVSVVGHRHPKRDSEGIESMLLGITSLGKKTWANMPEVMTRTWSKSIDVKLREADTAFRHFEADRALLRRELGKRSYDLIGLEEPESNTTWYAENEGKIRVDEAWTFAQLKIQPALRRRARTFLYQPARVLRAEEPALFSRVRITTFEPHDEDAAAYRKDRCPAKPERLVVHRGSTYGSYYAAFFTSLRLIDGVSEKTLLGGLGEKLGAVEGDGLWRQNPLEWNKTLDPKTFAETVLRKLGLEKISAETKDLLVKAYNERFKPFDDCSGRDALLAQNMVSELRRDGGKNVINFLGIAHLPALAHYLTKECEAMAAENTKEKPAAKRAVRQ